MKWITATLLGATALLGSTASARAGDDGFCDRRVIVTRTVTVVRHVPAPRRVYVPERWETRVERVLVREGHWRETVEPAEWSVRFDLRSRRLLRVCLREETVHRTWVPARYEEHTIRVHIPGHWVTVA
jgi:hypothetical protein